MKVLHVIAGVAPRYGGPSIAVHAMAREQAALGDEVTVITTDADGAGRLDVPLDRPVERDGVSYRYFRRSLPGEWKFSWGLTRWLYRNVADYAVVHVHAAFSYSTIPACRAAAARGVPYVVRPLGTLDPWSLSQGRLKKRLYYALLERAHLQRAAAIHATSEAEAAGVAALGFGSRVRVVPLGVELAGESVRAAPAPGAPLRLLFLSRLHPKKGLPLVLEAMAGLRRRGTPVELTVAGEGEPAYRASLERLCRELGIAESVRFVGHLQGEAKADALRSADLFVLTSYQENFGIAVAEALAAGLPVLVSDRVALAEQVVESDSGLRVPCDAGAVEEALATLAARPADLPRMGANGAAFARETLSWKRTAERLSALYREVTAGPTRGGRRASAVHSL